MKLSGQAAIVLGILSKSDLVEAALFKKQTIDERLAETLGQKYAEITKNWDPIYGPDLLWWGPYGGTANFEGHKKNPTGAMGPGTDYSVPIGTPLIPACTSSFVWRGLGKHGGLCEKTSSIANPRYMLIYVHLDEAILNEAFDNDRTKFKEGKPFRALLQNEIIALSGDTGRAPPGQSRLPSHLHVSLGYEKIGSDRLDLDYEKYGLDGNKPIFHDAKTNITVNIQDRLERLNEKLETFKEELAGWPKELEEIKGTLEDLYNKMGDVKGQQIVDNKHFQEMRALLKKKTLEDKTYTPGTKPYSLMIAIMTYSMVPPYSNQEVVLFLPFIAPAIAQKYKKVFYENGPFYQLKNHLFVPVEK